MNLYCCLWKNEETLTICNSPCEQRTPVNWTVVVFEPLACRMYQFVDLACKTQLHLPAKATHPTRYNTSALLLSASSLTVTTNQNECVSRCTRELYQTYFNISQSPPLSEQCRFIVAMWVGGFGILMQRSLTLKVHEPENAASESFSKFLLMFSLLEYAVHKTSYIWSVFSFFHKQQYKFVTKWRCDVTFNKTQHSIALCEKVYYTILQWNTVICCQHLLHSPQTLITHAVQNNVLKVTGIQYRFGVTVKLFKL